MKVSTILDHIDSGQFALPKFQRGYVWNRDQVCGLMDSLYRRHPVGSEHPPFGRSPRLGGNHVIDGNGEAAGQGQVEVVSWRGVGLLALRCWVVVRPSCP